ncbi:MAG: MarR family transcriptional regulator [Anaerolineae bacterium]|nr:MarR family transcriptional regulator [Anaerolineae bacterium]
METCLETFRKAIEQLMRLSMHDFWRYAKSQGLSMSQMMALRQIHYRDDCNISSISDELGITSAASSQLLDRLVQQGLVIRSEHPQDRRNKQLALSEKGQRILQEGLQARQRWIQTLIERLNDEERQKVSEALHILIEKTTNLH